MAREAEFFNSCGGDSLRAFLALSISGGNVPPMWIERARLSRKKREAAVARALKKGGAKGILDLEDWYLAYRKEHFYEGIRALLDLERSGKTKI